MFLFTHTHTHTANTHEHTHTEHTHAECQPMVVRETSRKVLRLGANFDIIDAAVAVCVAAVCCYGVCDAVVCIVAAAVCVLSRPTASPDQRQVLCLNFELRHSQSNSTSLYLSVYAADFEICHILTHTHSHTYSHTHTCTQSVCASIIFEFRKTSKLSFEIILNVLFRTQRK